MKPKLADVNNFLKHSNYIEGIYSPEAHADAYRAWRYAFINKDKVSDAYILMIHKLLMRRLNPRIAGKLRRCAVYIGGQKKEFTGMPDLVKALRDHVDLYMVEPQDQKGKEAYAKFMHVHFENLHPFEDGNGRVGRILLNIHRINMGLPLMTILEHERGEYYEWFRQS